MTDASYLRNNVYLAGVFALVALGLAAASAQEDIAKDKPTCKLPPFSLKGMEYPETASIFHKRQIDRFNVAMEEFAEAYRLFGLSEASLNEVLEAAGRVREAAKDVYDTPADRLQFANKHLDLARSVEHCVIARNKAGAASDQEVRQARFWRLTLDLETLPPGSKQQPLPVDPRIGKVAVPELERADAKALAKVNAHLIDARAYGSNLFDFFPSDDAKFAVVVEKEFTGAPRFALWDLEIGKLMRFLSATPEKGTLPYTGDDAAEFGAKVNFEGREMRRFVFSTDRKWVVGIHQRTDRQDEIYVWHTETGALSRKILSAHHHPDVFYFIDEQRIIAKSFPNSQAVLEMIDVESGEVQQLIKPGSGEVYGGVYRDGQLVLSGNGIFTLDLNTRLQTKYERPPPGTSRLAAERMWFSPSGKHLLVQRSTTMEVWDVESRSFMRDFQVLRQDQRGERSYVAKAANLFSRRHIPERRIEFVDLDKAEVVTTMAVPFENVGLCALANDAKRMVLLTDDRYLLLVLDFPEGLPRGQFSIDDLIRKAERKPLR